jgi:cytochrome c
MKRYSAIILLGIWMFSCSKSRDEKRILVYYKTTPATTTNIYNGVAAISKYANEQGIKADTTQNGAFLVEDSLKKYSAVVLLQTKTEALNYRQINALERFVQAGGGLAAVNSPLQSRYTWPWYHKAAGADELQQNPSDSKSVTPVSKNEGKLEKSLSYDGGRVYVLYTDEENNPFGDTGFMQKVAEGIQYVIGDNKELNYEKVKSEAVPDDNRFVKAELGGDLDEPMKLDVAGDGSVYIIERKGAVKRYNPATNTIKVIARMNVFSLLEDGLLGMALDPDYDNNHWVYFYYSPAGDKPKQHVSRFELIGDSLVMASEKVLLEVLVQRETCCHSGGDLEFGPDGNLYISVGDNTSSKESSGYTPLDERPGRAPFDAQKSSSNTNDLRGKILRIKPQQDGTYSIPAGNLFPKGTANTRPEIYAMGCRNPFRISIDSKTNYLYWGDVGPDSGLDSTRGPQSYDEINQAKKAGYFGWPYFVGNNKAYPDYDFATNTILDKFQDPQAAVNTSPNNTGLQQLPQAQLPIIWYPYGESREFPMLGNGSRSIMAGPIYYSDNFANARSRFPKYYDGKLFIFEWARSWIQVVSFDKDAKVEKIEPFLPQMEIVKPIDIHFAKDGALYLIEYGSAYFAKNPEARLSKIEYAEGNRAPVPSIIADKTVGAAPLTVQFSATKSIDYDKDSLTYQWNFTGADGATSKDASPSFTFTKPGIYKTELMVTDKQGESASTTVEIKVGNSKPELALDVKGNRTFFWDNHSLDYQVKVTDKEDGSLDNGIDPAAVQVNFDYLPQGRDLALVMEGQYDTGSAKYLAGKQLIDGSDCKSCHMLDKPSVGPAYTQVAQRYKDDKHALGFLPMKIIKGGNGNWGDRLMSAHPQLTVEQTTEMVRYILSLSDQKAAMPAKGTVVTRQHIGTGEEGKYFFTLTYTDKGANTIGPLTTREVVALRNPKVEAEEFDASANSWLDRPNAGALAFMNARNGSHLVFKQIDLTNVQSLTYRLASEPGGTIEVHLDSPGGEVISSVNVKSTGGFKNWLEVKAPVKATTGVHDLYFVFTHGQIKDKKLMTIDWIYFSNGSKLQASIK